MNGLTFSGNLLVTLDTKVDVACRISLLLSDIVVTVHFCNCFDIKRQLAYHNLIRSIKFAVNVLYYWLPRTLGIIFAKKRRDSLVWTKLFVCHWCFWFEVIIDLMNHQKLFMEFFCESSYPIIMFTRNKCI